MEIKEAIKFLDKYVFIKGDCNAERYEAYKLLISALEKQVPKEVIEHAGYYKKVKTYNCPVCGKYVEIDNDKKYCSNCGQSLRGRVIE